MFGIRKNPGPEAPYYDPTGGQVITVAEQNFEIDESDPTIDEIRIHYGKLCVYALIGVLGFGAFTVSKMTEEQRQKWVNWAMQPLNAAQFVAQEAMSSCLQQAQQAMHANMPAHEPLHRAYVAMGSNTQRFFEPGYKASPHEQMLRDGLTEEYNRVDQGIVITPVTVITAAKQREDLVAKIIEDENIRESLAEKLACMNSDAIEPTEQNPEGSRLVSNYRQSMNSALDRQDYERAMRMAELMLHTEYYKERSDEWRERFSYAIPVLEQHFLSEYNKNISVETGGNPHFAEHAARRLIVLVGPKAQHLLSQAWFRQMEGYYQHAEEMATHDQSNGKGFYPEKQKPFLPAVRNFIQICSVPKKQQTFAERQVLAEAHGFWFTRQLNPALPLRQYISNIHTGPDTSTDEILLACESLRALKTLSEHANTAAFALNLQDVLAVLNMIERTKISKKSQLCLLENNMSYDNIPHGIRKADYIHQLTGQIGFLTELHNEIYAEFQDTMNAQVANVN